MTTAHDPWAALRRLTAARIALGRSGAGLPTKPWLDFGLAHALARDAVHAPFDADGLAAALAADGWDSLRVHSAAPDRSAYLQRPDWGRRLDEASVQRLAALPPATGDGPRLAIVLADGLAALAAWHALPLLAALRPALPHWRVTPVVLAEQARVALGDPIGAALGADAVVVMLGERPGLSSPDSLGLYLTWAPRPGRHDAERNCISNVRPAGLAPTRAAARLAALLDGARRLGATGVVLKEPGDPSALPHAALPGARPGALPAALPAASSAASRDGPG
jgi:ethanolamine ammonia-lyase small subunit